MSARASNTKLVLNITRLILHVFLNIIFYALVVLLIMKLSTNAFEFSYRIFGNATAEAQPGRDRTLQIKKGESTLDVAKKLELNRLIVDKYAFYVKAKITKRVLMPGTYVINSSMTYNEIFDTITNLSASVEEEPKE